MTNGRECHNEAWYITAKWYADTQSIHNVHLLFICCYNRGDHSYRLRDCCHILGSKVNVFHENNISALWLSHGFSLLPFQ